MSNALWITLIGMGMVFASILLLWGLMVALVRLTTEKESRQVLASPEIIDQAELQELPDQRDTERRKRAVAASVAVALALSQEKGPALADGFRQAGPFISPWLGVQRAARLNRNAQIHRKRVTR